MDARSDKLSKNGVAGSDRSKVAHDHARDHFHVHEEHPAIVKRLQRAAGHLRSVIEMLEAGKPCLTVAQQLHAVEKAISQAKRTLIQDHLDQCLEETVGALPREQRRPIDDFKDIVKYL